MKTCRMQSKVHSFSVFSIFSLKQKSVIFSTTKLLLCAVLCRIYIKYINKNSNLSNIKYFSWRDCEMSFIALDTKRNQEYFNHLPYIFHYFEHRAFIYYIPICCKIWSIIKSLIWDETVLGWYIKAITHPVS